MSITIKEVKSRKDLKKFIFLPEKIHADHENWVHPIYMDEWTYFDAKKNKAFSYSDTILLLAYKGDELVGRIMGIINSRYNEYKQEKTARFGYLETWEDEEVVRALLLAVEDWAREREMLKMIGPYGFTDQDPEGFLIEGFENRATIATYYNFDWMPGMVEKLGYTKDVDYFVYKLEVPKEIPEFYKKILERVKRKGNFELIELRKRRQIKPWIVPVLDLMNECYIGSNIYGYTPLDKQEMMDLAKRYLPVLDPRFVKVITREGDIVAFIVGIPDMTAGIKKAKGRLLPFGFLKILRAAKKNEAARPVTGRSERKLPGPRIGCLDGSRNDHVCKGSGL